MRTRLWLATSVNRYPNNDAYYINRHGQLIVLWRYSESEAQLRPRAEADQARSSYRFFTIRGELGNPTREQRVFDPREQPGYKAGQGASSRAWAAIDIDCKTLRLVATRARCVNNAGRSIRGRGGHRPVAASSERFFQAA